MPQPVMLKKLKLNSCMNLQDIELTPRIDVLFIIGDWKSRKSRNTWSNRQIGLGVQNEAGQRLIEFCQENALFIAKEKPQKDCRRANLHLKSNPISARDAQRAQTNLVCTRTQGPHGD